jgi:hypothetical protein
MKKETPKLDEVAVIVDRLEKITSGAGTRNDWEDLLSIRFHDERAEALRQLFHAVSDAFPGDGMAIYSPAGMDILRAILKALKHV